LIACYRITRSQKNGLLKQLTKALVERALQAEMIYTTNAIESVNMSLRKVTKSRGSFPNDESVMKLFYLALQNISKKWTMPLRDWKPALNRFTIQLEEKMPQH
jgi:transposase-like protein